MRTAYFAAVTLILGVLLWASSCYKAFNEPSRSYHFNIGG